MRKEIDCSCVDPLYQIADDLWSLMEPLLPAEKPKPKGGRPLEDSRKMMTGILYVLRTGCQWQALPRCLGAGSTVHDRFQLWRSGGVFEQLWRSGLLVYDLVKEIDWEWQAIDGAMTKAPLGQESTGANPTDRAKRGVKRSLLVDGKGIPLAVAVDGANRHDMKLTEDTLKAMMIKRPDPQRVKQNMCMDKAYDFDEVRKILSYWGYIPHIRKRGEEIHQKIAGNRARRWVVERTHSWLNRFRRLLIRWEKKKSNYLALLHFACALICFRAAMVFG